jgi:hypothetical protein
MAVNPGFLDRSQYFLLGSSLIILKRVIGSRSRPLKFSDILVVPEIQPGTSESVARNFGNGGMFSTSYISLRQSFVSIAVF